MAFALSVALAILLTPGVGTDGGSTRDASLQLKATQYRFGERSWAATLRDQKLTVRLAREERVFSVSAAQLRQLRDVIERERFFDLAPSYGEHEPHDAQRTIAITTGGRSKTVVIYATVQRETRTDELVRALRVAVAARGLFDWADAMDTRREDEELMSKLVR